jgi:hypothetical protein
LTIYPIKWKTNKREQEVRYIADDTGYRSRIPRSDSLTAEINQATVAIVQAYLNYTGQIVRDALVQQGYDSRFKEIDDDLVLKPNELIELINKVQNALYSAED